MKASSAHVSSLSSWVRTIKLALDAQGLDGMALLQQAGMDADVLADPNGRVPLAATTRLWEIAIDATADPAFGLTVSNFVQQTTFHALGYSLIASKSLKDVFERLVRYFHIVSNAADVKFERLENCYRFRILQLGGEQPAFAAQDALLATNLLMCRSLAGREFSPLAVRLLRPRPQERKPYEKIFRVEVEFSAEEMSMDFAIDAIEQTLLTANEELAQHNEAILERLLAGVSRDPLSQKVHLCLLELLSNGEPSHEQVAKRINMSSRNMQRKLSEAGTSYTAILDDTRKQLGLNYLQGADYTMSEITYLLGFSDTSSFSRACKRWLGMSPSAYRNAQGICK
jgi:AraC-like DNA-binding protein